MTRPRSFDPTPFLAPWPPREPLELVAAWLSLQDDIDGLAGTVGYLCDGDAGNTIGMVEGPMLRALFELDAAVRALEPDTVDTATAIVIAAQRDLAEGGGLLDPDEGRLRMARSRAWPGLKR